MLNNKFQSKIARMTVQELCKIIGQMANQIEFDIVEWADYDKDGKILPIKDQSVNMIKNMMELLEYD